MSQYVEVETQMSDPRLLCEALQKLELAAVFHAQPVKITDYHGNSHMVTVTARDPNAWSTIGFALNNGTFQAFIDDFDQRGVAAHEGPAPVKYDDIWINRLTDTYMEEETIENAVLQGYVFEGRELAADGTIELRFGMGVS